jgi:hypothetical protein
LLLIIERLSIALRGFSAAILDGAAAERRKSQQIPLPQSKELPP